MKTLRTAILGCGSFANRHAQNLLLEPEKFKLVAFCDQQLERAQVFSGKYGDGATSVYAHHHELFERTELDLCLVCLPPYAHDDEVECAAARHVHLFIEKPVALSSSHAWHMVAAAEDAGIKTQVGFWYRFGTAIERLRSLQDRGEVGTVGLMSAFYFCNHLHAPWWRDRARSGGQLVEQVIHLVDLMRYVMGEPRSVYSLQKNLYHREVPDYTSEDISGTVIGFQGGGIGVLYASNAAIPSKWTYGMRLVAQNLTAEFSNVNCAMLTHTGGPVISTEAVGSEANAHLLELLDLYDAIVQDRPTRTPIREGALTLDLALAARRSAEQQTIEVLS